MLRSTCLSVCIALAAGAAAQTAHQAPARPVTAEVRTAKAYDAAVKAGPPAVRAFLDQFPKGGDLHVHLSGAVYAETFIRDAGEDGLCVDPAALSFAEPPCAGTLIPAVFHSPISYAYGVNDSGIVVGYSDVDGSGDPHAFIFENGVMLDLNSLIDPSSGWILTEAYAINGSGEIVGEGLLDGVEHAFLLDPISGTQSAGVASDPASDSTASDAATPEPAPWTLLAIGLIAVVSSRLRLRFPFPLPLPRLPRDPRQAHSQSDVSLR